MTADIYTLKVQKCITSRVLLLNKHNLCDINLVFAHDPFTFIFIIIFTIRLAFVDRKGVQPVHELTEFIF